MFVFAPNPSGRMIQRAAVDLGQVDLPAGAGSIVNVPFSIDTQPSGFEKRRGKAAGGFLVIRRRQSGAAYPLRLDTGGQRRADRTAVTWQ